MYDSNRQLSLPRPLFDSLRKISAVLKKAKAKKLIQFRQNIMQVNKRAGGRDYIVQQSCGGGLRTTLRVTFVLGAKNLHV